MRIAIVGLPSSGKTTVFKALTGANPASATEASLVAVRVPDDRVKQLSDFYKPKKINYASVEFVDLGGAAGLRKDAGELGAKFLSAVRPAQALLHVVDGFSLPESVDEFVAEAIASVDTELVLADLGQVEKRIERLKKEGIKAGPMRMEFEKLEKTQQALEAGTPLRCLPELALDDDLRSFAFLSAKPVLTVINTTEEQSAWSAEGLEESLRHSREGDWGCFIPLCAALEAEIADLEPADARAFLADYGIAEPARERVINLSFDLLGLMSFLTVGEDEVRAWTIPKQARAQDAAGVIHSDIARGFIRAEVLDWKSTLDLGGFDEARKQGKIRLEGKDYLVKDGDVISFRFNV